MGDYSTKGSRYDLLDKEEWDKLFVEYVDGAERELEVSKESFPTHDEDSHILRAQVYATLAQAVATKGLC